MDVSNADVYELLIMIFFLLLAGGLIVLQYFLCKHKKGRIFGKILPILSCTVSLILSVLVIILVVIRSSDPVTITEDENGVVHEYVEESYEYEMEDESETWVALFVLFLMINIPTAVFTGEYFIVRDIPKKKEQAAEELNRTRINDL